MLPYNGTYEFNALLSWKDWYIVSMRTIPNKISTLMVTPFLGYKRLETDVVYHVNSKKWDIAIPLVDFHSMKRKKTNLSYKHSIDWFQSHGKWKNITSYSFPVLIFMLFVISEVMECTFLKRVYISPTSHYSLSILVTLPASFTHSPSNITIPI